MTAPAIHASIDDLLGARSGRFFGERYRLVGQELTVRDRWSDPSGAVGLSGNVVIAYPDAWSTKGTRAVRPHVSTIDGAVTASLCASALLASDPHVFAAQIEKAWISDLRLMAGGTPQEDAESVALLAVVTGRHEGDGATMIDVDANLGSMRLLFTVTVIGRARLEDLRADGAARPLVGTGYVGGVLDLRSVVIDRDRRTCTAELSRSGAATPPGRAMVAAGHRDHHTDVEHIVAVAQAAQALLYDLDGVSRASSNTLWMRSYHAKRTLAPVAFDGPAALRSSIVDHETVEMTDGLWSVSEWEASCADVTSTFEVAHRLPDGARR
ncbi:AvrD family protein [Williamsia herbipolensis]|uniref:AvrD family protein n=1 Tax=Williamsia herbipolensis TaxID=1603258 RepID=A0AAU4K7U4_9NOCA|nr:AvrD family protein [Williamsia herbipolensis]